jgi:hypothetical protein
MQLTGMPATRSRGAVNSMPTSCINRWRSRGAAQAEIDQREIAARKRARRAWRGRQVLRPPTNGSGVDDAWKFVASRGDNPHGGSCVCAKLSRPTAKGPDAAAERQGQRPARKASGPGRRRSTVALGWPERRGDEEMPVSYSADRHGPKARPRQGYSPEGQRQAKRRLCS